MITLLSTGARNRGTPHAPEPTPFLRKRNLPRVWANHLYRGLLGEGGGRGGGRKRAKKEMIKWEKVKVEVRERVEVKVEVIQTIPVARANLQERVVVTLLRRASDSCLSLVFFQATMR